MKKTLLFILLLAGAVSYGVYFKNQQELSKSAEAKNDKFTEKWKAKVSKIEGYVQWRNDQIKNVFTGEVNSRDYFEVVKYANELKFQSFNKAGGLLGLDWVSRGPDSQAGRTRAILFDVLKPNVIYTGGISGGLFKSVDNGENWERVASYNGNNASIMSLAQSISGVIYVGTGETLAGSNPDGTLFNAAITGDGIYKSSDDGATWTQIDVTNEFNYPTFSGEWSSVRSIATHPTKSNLILVGNNSGIRISTNAGDAQPTFFNAIGGGSNVSDVQFTSDGKEAWAACGGRLYKSTDEVNNFQTFTQLSPITSSRAQIAISKVDASGNYTIYASFTNFPAGCLVGVYKSTDKGLNWTQIAFAGGLDPFAQPTGGVTATCQGWYDHCIAVNPVDKDKIYIGGITFYTWGAGSGGLKRADQIDSEGSASLSPNYIHADKHTIRFSPHDPTGNTMMIGGDGGINRCLNANSGFPDNMVYTENNKSLITLQCFSVGSGKYGEVAAGAQDNGSQYVNYKGISSKAAIEYSGGDGVGGAEISNLSPNILFSGIYFGNILRSLNNGSSSTNFLDANIDPAGCGHITCSPLNTATETCDDRVEEGQSFIYPFFLMETFDRLNPKNDLFVYARDETIVLPDGSNSTIKDTILPGKVNTNAINKVISEKIPGIEFDGLGLDFEINDTIFPGDSMFFENKFDAKYFVPTKCGSRFYVCTNPLQEGASPRFSSVTVPLQSAISRMDASSDGDLVAAVSGSRVIIMQGWDAYDPDSNPGSVTNLNVNLSSIGASTLSGVWVNKSNKDHVLVSESGYGSTSKVFVSFNATSSSPTFTNIHNNLPEMPIYSCVIDKANPDRYILGTELGVWGSNDGGLTWGEENEGMGGRFPVFALRQNWMNNFNCDVLVAGTFGAGMYTSTTLMDCPEKNSLIWGRPKDATNITKVSVEINNIAVFPNPVQDIAKIGFDLKSNSNVTVKIIDLTGKVVSQKTYNNVNAGNNVLEYNVSNLAASTYFAVVSTDKQTYNNRLFIKK